MRERLFAVALPLLVSLGLAACSDKQRDPAVGYEVFAIEYAHSPELRKSTLIHGAPSGEPTAFSWMVWLIRGADRVVLVDTGFDRLEAAAGFGVTWYRQVPEVLRDLGIPPERITDVVITHLHFDHAGNGQPYTNAKFWIQRTELEWARRMVGEDRPKLGGVRLSDVRFLEVLLAQKRLSAVDGRTQIAEGIALHRGGGHTRGIQWVEIRTGSPVGTIVLASDNAYLYESIEELRPTGSTRDEQGDRQLLRVMSASASEPRLVIPGHDPEVMRRFPGVEPHVVRIK